MASYESTTEADVRDEAYPGTGAGYLYEGFDAAQWYEIAADAHGARRKAALRIADTLTAMDDAYTPPRTPPHDPRHHRG